MMNKRRIILKLFVLLLMGAAVNVAVAWGLIQCSPSEFEYGRARSAAQALDDKHQFMNWEIWQDARNGSEITLSRWIGPARGTIGLVQSSGAPALLVPDWAPELSPSHQTQQNGAMVICVSRADGWPLHSLGGTSGWITGARNNGAFGRGALATRPLVPYKAQNNTHFFPWLPLWPGFAINTIFYAAVCWLLFAAPLAVLRRLRLRLGKCPNCAYPTGTSPVCTECGKPLPARQPTTTM